MWKLFLSLISHSRYAVIALLLIVLSQAAVAAPGDSNRPQLSADQAARRAQSQYGGKVLKVQRSNGGYRVKLLLDSGRVTTVTIGARNQSRKKR